ncbi:MAG: phosphoserine phosphatase SerB [Rhodobacteraceae bacterium]|nr:phosphoserine phosphatase SerB [Paracoccaceae bacterium]
MFVATMITNPSEPVLTVGNVLPYHRALGGGEFRWLQDGIACEFPLEVVPDGWRNTWQSLQDRGVDLVIQKADGRRKQMLLADMDSTMIQQECIDELADEAGFGERVAAITRRAMNGELVFETALKERVALLAGLPESVIDRVLETRITPMPGGPVLLKTMTGSGAYAALVSGGFTVFTEAVAHGLGFDENRANTLEIVDGVLTGRVLEPILGREAKVEALHQISAARGLMLDQVMAVGDGANDLGMLKLAGSGVALHAKPAVAAQCEIRINFGDLTALLFLQGYSREEFLMPSQLRMG